MEGDPKLIARAEESVKKAEKKIRGLFKSTDDAIDLFQQAANSFKLAKSWDRAGSVNVKLAECHWKLQSLHEAASVYVDAAKCYKKTNVRQAIECFDKAVNIYLQNGRLNMAAKLCKGIGELYEQGQKLEQAIVYYERSAELFDADDAPTSANQCKQKVAEFSAHLGNYPKAIAIFEQVACYSININLLKYGVRGHLLHAGLCQLCKGDFVAITNALERYQDLDPTFSRTREYKFLADLASAVDEEDTAKFTRIVREFNSMDPRRAALLVRVRDALKAKEREDDDLT